jgi:hypothetical protein
VKHAFLFGIVLAVGCGSDDGAQLDASSTDDGQIDVDAPHDDSVVLLDGGSSCPASTWCLETHPAGTTKLHGVFARTNDDVFAVGASGTILRRQGGTWSAMSSPTTADLRAVWAASATAAWAVGSAGTVLRWDGSTWAAAGPTTSVTLNAVWGTSANDVWVVGGASAFRWNGSTWTPYGLSGTAMLDVHGTSASDAWVASEGGYIKRWNGTAWSTSTGVGVMDLFAVRAISASNVWITTGVPGKRARSWNGSTWTDRDVGATLVRLWDNGASDLWGVSATSPGKVAHWTGSAWTLATPTGVTLPLRGVSGSGTYLWVVGDGGTIVHRH